MTTGPYDIGDAVRLQADFTDLAGAPSDPTAVVLTVRKPDDTVTTVTATNDATAVGRFTADVTIDQSGIWRYRFAGTGAVVAAEEQTFLVRKRRVPAPTP